MKYIKLPVHVIVTPDIFLKLPNTLISKLGIDIDGDILYKKTINSIKFYSFQSWWKRIDDYEKRVKNRNILYNKRKQFGRRN